jgi:hypothetical protein
VDDYVKIISVGESDKFGKTCTRQELESKAKVREDLHFEASTLYVRRPCEPIPDNNVKKI